MNLLGAKSRAPGASHSNSTSSSSPGSAALVTKATESSKRLGSRATQPLRCAIQPCAGFGSACSVFKAGNAWTPQKEVAGDMACVTNKCYEGKCGMGGNCRAHGEVCYTYAPHTCCTGTCNGVALYNDCLRLLKLSHDITTHGGIAVDRQCERIGTCGFWPGEPPPPTDMSTPWAVPADDDPSKYYMMKGISFASHVKVDTAHFVARKAGQVYESTTADATRPASMSDAGVIIFSPDSVVSLDNWAVYQEGQEPNPVQRYCIAAITRNGAGGAFYAVGKDCCDEEEGGFAPCLKQGAWNEAGGDYALQDPTQAHVGLVLAQQQDKFANALAQLEVKHGKKFHGGGKGVETSSPFYVRMLAPGQWKKERAAPSIHFAYVAEFKPTYCVAPIGNDDGSLPDMIKYFAVGKDCCRNGGTFDCGPVAQAGLSGKTDTDVNGEYLLAVKMGMVRYGLPDGKVHRHPLFVQWVEERLVPDPVAVGPHGGELKKELLAGTR